MFFHLSNATDFPLCLYSELYTHWYEIEARRIFWHINACQTPDELAHEIFFLEKIRISTITIVRLNGRGHTRPCFPPTGMPPYDHSY